MKFICNECNKTKDIYKVKFTAVGSNLVCKDAYCCNEYMEQIITEEYKGMPEVKRPDSDTNHSSSYDSDKLWKEAKKKIASGEPPQNKNN